MKTISKTSTVADRIHLAKTTPEMAFIDSNVHDDARQGIATLTMMEESATIMVSMISELRILFGLNVGFAFFVLYYATFLRTISNVVHQVLLLFADVFDLAFSLCSGAIVPHFSCLDSDGISFQGAAQKSADVFEEAARHSFHRFKRIVFGSCFSRIRRRSKRTFTTFLVLFYLQAQKTISKSHVTIERERMTA
jgi:hypothetical protein